MDELKDRLLSSIKDFIDRRIESLEETIEFLKAENKSLKDQLGKISTTPIKGVDGAPGKNGQDGKDGKDFDQAAAQNMLDLMFAPYKMKLENLKDGKDGRDGRDGQDGKDGENGKDGKSAYDIAVEYGFKGTQLEFAQKQFGRDGKDGENGKDGQNGVDGNPGKSAYEIAVDHGFKGTQLEFAQKQFGQDGKDGQDGQDGRNGVDGLGFDDLKVEFDGERTISLKFVAEGNTKSYDFKIPAQIYKGVYKEGHTYQVGDTVTDNGSLWSCLKATSERPISAEPGLWQLAVKHGRQGEKGSSGMNTYELALKNGFKGSEKEYLASIRRGVGS